MKKYLIKIFILIILIYLLPVQSFSQNDFSYKIINTENGLLSNEVYDVLLAKDGRLWAVTNNGISIYNGRSFENYISIDGINLNSAYKLYEDDKGRIWILLFNGNVVLYDHYFRNTKLINEALQKLKKDYGVINTIYVSKKDTVTFFTSLYSIEDTQSIVSFNFYYDKNAAKPIIINKVKSYMAEEAYLDISKNIITKRVINNRLYNTYSYNTIFKEISNKIYAINTSSINKLGSFSYVKGFKENDFIVKLDSFILIVSANKLIHQIPVDVNAKIEFMKRDSILLYSDRYGLYKVRLDGHYNILSSSEKLLKS